MSQPVFVLSIALVFSAIVTALIARFVSVDARRARVVALAATAATIVAAVIAIFGGDIRVNFTPSMPLGIYRLEPLPTSGVVRGMFVAVCVPTNAADLGRRRGYLSVGPCPDDTEPLLKTVVGIPGDDVVVSNQGVTVNEYLLMDSRPVALDHAGRRLSPWPLGHYKLGKDQVWLYAVNDRSWDSRYWGPARVARILARAIQLLVVPDRVSP